MEAMCSVNWWCQNIWFFGLNFLNVSTVLPESSLLTLGNSYPFLFFFHCGRRLINKQQTDLQSSRYIKEYTENIKVFQPHLREKLCAHDWQVEFRRVPSISCLDSRSGDMHFPAGISWKLMRFGEDSSKKG